MKKYYITPLFLWFFISAHNNAYAQVQEAWISSGLESLGGASTENPALVLDNSENIIAGVNTHAFGDQTGQMSTFRISKFKPDGTKVFDVLESVSSVNKSLVGIALHAANIYCAVREWRVVTPSKPRLLSMFSVYKYNASGGVVWKRSYGDGDSNNPNAIAVDAAGNVYLTGSCRESGLVQDNDDLPDYLTVKWNSSGTLQWARRYDGASPGEGFNVANDVVVDGSGNVYITGASQRNGEIGYATIKYNSSGTLLWEQRYTGTGSGDDRALAITLDINGFVYVTGSSEGSIATVKYNNDGAVLWAKRKGSGGGSGRVIKVDASGNVYVAGNSSQAQSAVVKYLFNGDELWTSGRPGALHSLTLDAHGNVYVAGTTSGKGLTEKYNSSGISQWFKTYDSPLATGVNKPVAVSTNDNVYVLSFVSLNRDGNANPYYRSRLYKYTQCQLNCPQNIVANNDPGKCSAIVNFNPVTSTGECGNSFTYSHDSGTEFPVGTTTVTVTSDANGATCSFTITVLDNEFPVITNFPASKTVDTDPGVCYASAASVNAGIATATDNCNPVSVTGLRSDGQSLAADYAAGTTVITWRATDASNNTTTYEQTITVVDNTPPEISNVYVSKSVLSPPNHKLVDITVDYTVSDNCSVITSVDITSNEPEAGLNGGDLSPDIIKIDDLHWQLRAERDPKGDGRIYTIIITATDEAGNVSVQNATVAVAHNILSPPRGKPFKVGSSVSLSGVFWDAPGKTHTAKWLIDGQTSVKGSVAEPSGLKNGTVTGTYKFTSPGVYKLQMNVTDQTGVTTYTNTNGELEAFVVVYDPSGGYAYGDGSFYSPAGALPSDPTISGDVSYGFAVNYYKGATNPKGEIQFNFMAGDFEFNAVNLEYLVIDKALAQFKGTGKISGGQSGVAFVMTVLDGQLDGSGEDKVRMKVYNKNTGQVYYDNQPGASDTDHPTATVRDGSTLFIGTTKEQVAAGRTTTGTETLSEESVERFDVMAYPNPSQSGFTIEIRNDNAPTDVRVINSLGTVIESIRTDERALRLGQEWQTGMYIIDVVQGGNRKTVKLVKY